MEFRRQLVDVDRPDGARTQWSVAGERGAVSVMVQLYPPELVDRYDATMPGGVDEWARMFGAVLTDAGWLVPIDLGEHHRLDDPRAGLSRMDECPALDGAPCWYGSQLFGSYEPVRLWADAGLDDEVLRRWLIDRYAHVFGEPP